MNDSSKANKAISGRNGAIVSPLVALFLFGSLAAGCSASPAASSLPIPLPEVPYLGQKPPGLKPEIFAPGIVSGQGTHEWSGTFSPDGAEYYFSRVTGDSPSALIFTKFENGAWTSPQPCSFTCGFRASEPHLTFDNKTLYFMWNRSENQTQPLPGDEAKYYFVERTPSGWSEPKYAGQGMFMSSSMDGQIYTTDMSSRVASGSTYLSKVTTADGVFANYEKLDIKPRMGSQAHPCIAPDGSYMLFDVNGGSYLYVSFKKSDGAWGEAIDLTKHGFDPLAGGPCISPDGKYLFFALNGDIWWVDIKVVESLKPKA